MKFPYIIQLNVKDNFAHKNFDIPSVPLESFKHIILTGKNGSGKTTILKRIFFQINAFRTSSLSPELINSQLRNRNKDFEDLAIKYNLKNANTNLFYGKNDFVFSFYRAHRKVEVDAVKSVGTEEEFLKVVKSANQDDFGRMFKQYLVNKKVYEAFDFMNSKLDKINESRLFFDDLKEIFRNIFGDMELDIDFEQEIFEFYIAFGDGRRVTFNQLSDGFSAFINILMELLIKIDLIRKEKRDYTFQPAGIVLIDEPETHLHIEMQYEILPLLTKLFPNIQFIVATHSPAVISSIKNAVVMDLTNKKEISGEQVGSSFSSLMVKHFGLDNEFSPVADKIIFEVSEAAKNNDIKKLKEIIAENEAYITPSLRFEIENQIITINSKKEI